jgi:Dolichyl-phosphate-mannose-protein mannosyltransferase
MAMSETQTANVVVADKPARIPAVDFFGLLAHPAGWTVCLALLLGVALLRITSTYHVFNHTIDEASHIAGGIEWWDKGTYTLETKHTPLARVSVALGPYLAGMRWMGFERWQDTYPILSATGNYWHNLTLGRIGVLPYFIIATLVVFFWTKRLFGVTAAVLAVAVFTQLPTMLAHSSVATTDVALTAIFCCSLYFFTLWLREPNLRTAAQFGVAVGLALATKLSTVVFLPACAAPILVMYAASGQRKWRVLFRSLVIVALCAFLALWAVYRFSHVPLTQATGLTDRVAAKVFGRSSAVTGAIHVVASHVPVPAPEFLDGIRMLRDQNHMGSRAYLFGRVRVGGWWYFFFAALALKTPVAVLLLAALGSVVARRQYWRNRENWEIAAPLAAFAMIMLSSTPARLDSGVRYVLPVFVFLSILAAFGLTTLWTQNRHRLYSRMAAIVLFGWLTLSSALAHPDYLAYFNEFGGKDPSHKIVVGDLDWGQDLTRLSTYMREHSIQRVSIAYDGFFIPDSLGFPETQILKCDSARPSGWVAMEVRRERLNPECYDWLAGQQVVAKVGKTMSLYYLQ